MGNCEVLKEGRDLAQLSISSADQQLPSAGDAPCWNCGRPSVKGAGWCWNCGKVLGAAPRWLRRGKKQV